MDMTPTSIYKTKDLPEAAFLLSQVDVRFVGLEPRTQTSYFFCFAPANRCQSLSFDFLSGKALVNARAYADAIRRCKDLVFSRERSVKP